MDHIGTPGGTCFAYLATSVAIVDTIVYAARMTEAVALYQAARGEEPFAIRQMADNE